MMVVMPMVLDVNYFQVREQNTMVVAHGKTQMTIGICIWFTIR